MCCEPVPVVPLAQWNKVEMVVVVVVVVVVGGGGVTHYFDYIAAAQSIVLLRYTPDTSGSTYCNTTL